MSTSTHIPSKRLALVVGVNHAPNLTVPSPLKHAVEDATAIATVLQQHCNFALLEPPLLDQHATSTAVKRAILKLARNRSTDDFLLLYFSGHGTFMDIEAGRQAVYLVTHDFAEIEVENDETFHLSLDWLRDKLYIGSQAGKVVIILDCCYGGEMARTTPDPYLQELRLRIAHYFDAPSATTGAPSNGLRYALTATGHNAQTVEREGHGLMTGFLLPALRGEIPDALGRQGQLSLKRLSAYLDDAMPEQPPSLSGDSASQSCLLANYPDRSVLRYQQPSFVPQAGQPKNYLPFPRDLQFQPRPGEFAQLETLLFPAATPHKPARIALLGIAGVGKTQLAIELAYRHQQRYPAGIFWMTATGTNRFGLQRELADLAARTDYLPPNDNPSNADNELRRAQHLSRYLATHAQALLILDNVEDANQLISTLPDLASSDLACTILYTSRTALLPADLPLSNLVPPGITPYIVKQLPEAAALRLMLETTRPILLSETLAGDQSPEADAARLVCQGASCLPLGLAHIRGLLEDDRYVSLVHLAATLPKQDTSTTVATIDSPRSAEVDLLIPWSDTISEEDTLVSPHSMETDVAAALPQQERSAPAKKQQGPHSIFETFRLSWQKVNDPRAQSIFKLASYFPEAASIPLWLLGLASGLGESNRVYDPLWEVCLQLQELSLLETLSGDQVRLHPLLREFGQQLVIEDSDNSQPLLQAAAQRLTTEFTDLNRLEQRARQHSYLGCLEQIHAAREYAELLGNPQAEQLRHVERWLDRESYLLGNEKLWSVAIPGLFYQQLYNRSVEAGHWLPAGVAPACWLQQEGQVSAEDPSLLRIFAGHTGWVSSVAFSPDGSQVLTGSWDTTARLWERSSGKLLSTLQGHTGLVMSVAFSPDGSQVLTGSGGIFGDNTARLWETSSGRLLSTLEGHTSTVYSVAFSPDGSQVLTGSGDKTARLWETSSGRLLSTLQGHTSTVYSVAFSPDGSQVLTGSGGIFGDNTARLWESSSGRLLKTLKGHTGLVYSVAFSPDGRQVLTGSIDTTARLWETSSGRLLGTLEGHTHWVRSVAFAPDGRQVLTGSLDKTARLWETSSGRLLSTLQGHTGYVTSVAFSPDGHLALTCDEHGWVFLWRASGADMGRLLGMYVATYEVGAVHWEDSTHVVLADKGGPRFRPHFYRLKLEGM